MNKHQLQNNNKKCWPPVHKTNEAWCQSNSNSIQTKNGMAFILSLFEEADFFVPQISSFSGFEIKHPIFELAELKVHRAQP